MARWFARIELHETSEFSCRKMGRAVNRLAAFCV
jgi:hypothetical protein